MLRKTKDQNSLNLFSIPEPPEQKEVISSNKNETVDNGTLRTTKKQNISENFFGTDVLSKSADIAEKVSKAMINEEKNNPNRLAELAEEQKSKKMGGFNSMTSNGSTILSANAENISDMRGPSKQLKTPISNSIFDPWKNAREAKIIDNKTATQIEKDQIATNKRFSEQKRMDDLVEALQNTDQRKASSIHRTGTGFSDDSNFKASKNNISIFDSGDFERIPEKTAGEKTSDEVELKRSQVDESWKNNGKSVNSNEITNRFFDTLIDKLDSNECR